MTVLFEYVRTFVRSSGYFCTYLRYYMSALLSQNFRTLSSFNILIPTLKNPPKDIDKNRTIFSYLGLFWCRFVDYVCMRLALNISIHMGPKVSVESYYKLQRVQHGIYGVYRPMCDPTHIFLVMNKSYHMVHTGWIRLDIPVRTFARKWDARKIW